MIIKIVNYTIQKQKLSVVTKAIQTFLKKIRQHEPNTFYEAYQKPGSTNFIHIMKFVDQASEQEHSSANYTQHFVKILYPACTTEPKFTDLSVIA